MKSRVKNILKNKLFKWIIWSLLIIWLFHEWYSIYIDSYNFWQLEKAKPILDTIEYEKIEWFGLLKKFNYIYDANIIPIKNCYYVSSFNGNESYIFWFQLESIIYKTIYWTKNYAYPKYDKPLSRMCMWWAWPFNGAWWCRDMSRIWFEEIISNPCIN